MRRIRTSWLTLALFLPALLVFQSCGALNIVCGSARPAPVVASLSPGTAMFTQVQQGLPLIVTGSHFVSSSVVIINGTTLSTTIASSTQLQVMVTSALITAPGTANVVVHTPAGNSGDIGCSSGGTSKTLVLTIT